MQKYYGRGRSVERLRVKGLLWAAAPAPIVRLVAAVTASGSLASRGPIPRPAQHVPGTMLPFPRASRGILGRRADALRLHLLGVGELALDPPN